MTKVERAKLQAEKAAKKAADEAKVATIATVEVTSVVNVGAPVMVPRDPTEVSRQFATAYWRGRRARFTHAESWSKAQDLLGHRYEAYVLSDHAAARPDLSQNPLKGC